VSGDIVARLRYETWLNPSEGETADAHYLAADALTEIERLRAAGDALAEAADEWPELVEAWQEARRER